MGKARASFMYIRHQRVIKCASHAGWLVRGIIAWWRLHTPAAAEAAAAATNEHQPPNRLNNTVDNASDDDGTAVLMNMMMMMKNIATVHIGPICIHIYIYIQCLKSRYISENAWRTGRPLTQTLQ
jgi:hypothetical protein